MIINTSKKDKPRAVLAAAHTADPIISISTSKPPQKPSEPRNGVAMAFIGTVPALPDVSYDNGMPCKLGDVIRLENGKFYIYALATDGKSYTWKPFDENLDAKIAALESAVDDSFDVIEHAISNIEDTYALKNEVSSSEQLAKKFENYYESTDTSSKVELENAFNDLKTAVATISDKGYATSAEVSSIIDGYDLAKNVDLNEFKNSIEKTIETNKQQWVDINSIQIIANNNAKDIAKINDLLGSTDFSKYALSDDVKTQLDNIIKNQGISQDSLAKQLEAYATKDEVKNVSSEIVTATQNAVTDITSRLATIEQTAATYGTTLVNHSNDITDLKKAISQIPADIKQTIEAANYATKNDLTIESNRIRSTIDKLSSTYAKSDDLKLSVSNIKDMLATLDYCNMSDFVEVSAKFYTKSETSSAHEIDDAIDNIYSYAADAYLLKSKADELYVRKSETSSAQQLAEKFGELDSTTTPAQVCALIDERGFANKDDVNDAIAELESKLKFDYVTTNEFKNVSASIEKEQTILECAVRHHHDQIDAIEKVLPYFAKKSDIGNYAYLSDVYSKNETSSAQEIAKAMSENKLDLGILSNYYTKSEISGWADRIKRNDDRIDELYEHDYHIQNKIEKNHDDIDELKEILRGIKGFDGIIDVSDIRKVLNTVSSDYTTSAQVSDIVSSMIAGIDTEFDPNVLSDYALSTDVYNGLSTLSTDLLDIIARTSCSCETSNYFDLRPNISNDVSGCQYIGFSSVFDKEPTYISSSMFLDNDAIINMFINVKRILFYISSDENFDIYSKNVQDLFYTVDDIITTESSLSSYEYDPETADVEETADAIEYIIKNYSQTNVSLAQKLKRLDHNISLLYFEIENITNKFDDYYTRDEIDEKLQQPTFDPALLSTNYVEINTYNTQIANLTAQLAKTEEKLEKTASRLQNIVFTMVANLSSNDNMVMVGDMRNAIISTMVELSVFLND